jgi:hypothetical protein
VSEKSPARQAAGFATAAKLGGSEMMRPAMEVWNAHWAEEADPEHKLSEVEREKRGRLLMRAHMTSMSAKSADASKQRAKLKKFEAEVALLRTLLAEIDGGEHHADQS